MLLGKRVLGEVFFGWVDEKTYAPSTFGVGMAVAVKKFDLRFFQQHRGWQFQLQLLENFCHPNLPSIWGYCMENQEFFIVYEYMCNGSLDNHLFEVAEDAEPLPWFTRLKIAIGAARGLAFLHSTEKKAIYRQFQTSNILLDGDFNAKLWNFDILNLDGTTCYSTAFTYVPTLITRNYIYIDPEYWTTGCLTMKSDIYGFGFVLLELLTDSPVLDFYSNRQNKYLFMSGKRRLISWLKRLMDRRLNGNYPLEGALQYVALVQKCTDIQSINRPTMDEVLDTLEHIHGIKNDPNCNSHPLGSESVDSEGVGSTEQWEDSLSVESLLNSYSGSNDSVLSGRR